MADQGLSCEDVASAPGQVQRFPFRVSLGSARPWKMRIKESPWNY